ncbi:FHA domain-containing protein [Rarobacter faecitabidus]|uniref:PSer/pThr/pTyr-binding forkhead associated (FHA) protein n=1 Tax=Rarobacter faecitabidus TaxID=13243 RepID=A0A542ZVN4_RARFA|nr:FHA domain-containing protein [Rarobacter faecitabidus]TQL64391.1 pSer/pThr/pTyr-binding forkhead associated (FHA) protein [Rarobacter faecitabidus]
MTPLDSGEQPPSNVDTTLSLGYPETADTSRPRIGLSPQESALVAALPDGAGILISHQGPAAGSRFLLDTDEVSVGRSEKADILLDDATVSRKHALFSKVAGGYEVRDVGSLNGTYVNLERIERTNLRTGDEVQIGKFRLTYYASIADGAGHS